MPNSKTYYCWMKYYDNDTFLEKSSDEVKYHTGHQHGVQPTQKDWDECLDSLVEKVNDIRKTKNLQPLLKSTINKDAERKTRSAK